MLDYVTQNLMDEGSPLGFRYLDKDLVSIFSPIGLVEGCANETNGNCCMISSFPRKARKSWLRTTCSL